MDDRSGGRGGPDDPGPNGEAADAPTGPPAGAAVPADVDGCPRETLATLADRLADHERLLLCLDFDGTLADIVDDPDAATPREGNRELVEALADDPRVALAVVSGRDLRDVRERVGVGGIVYAGNHGMELARGDADPAVPPAVERHVETVDRVAEALAEALAEEDGAFVENKGQTATVHFRHAPEERTDAVTGAVEEAVAADPGDLRITGGKQIVELRPPVDWDKGRAVELLDESRGEGCLTVYVGDDVTDEAAFRAIRPEGVGVLVGDRADTAATCRVADPAAVTALLEWLRDAGLDALAPGDADSGERASDDGAPGWDLPEWA